MATEKDAAINKLINGQVKISKDIVELKDGKVKVEEDIAVIKEDIVVIKKDIVVMKEDIVDIKEDIVVMKEDIVDIKEDVSEIKEEVNDLKQGQYNMDHMMLKLLDEMTSIKKIVINIENDLNPKVKTLFDADRTRQNDTTELQQICREQEERIENHELRITRLEQ